MVHTDHPGHISRVLVRTPDPPLVVLTLLQPVLPPSAGEARHQQAGRALAEHVGRHGSRGVAEAELATDNHRLPHSPAVSTEPAPHPAQPHLHSALLLRPPPSQPRLQPARHLQDVDPGAGSGGGGGGGRRGRLPAGHPRPLAPVTVVPPPAVKPALVQPVLRAVAVEVVHPDLALHGSELPPVGRSDGAREAERATDNVSLGQVPLVVTDSAPDSTVVNLHVTLVLSPPSSQPHTPFLQHLRHFGPQLFLLLVLSWRDGRNRRLQGSWS